MEKNNLVTCNKCNRVEFEVTREYAELESKQFNEFYYSSNDEVKSYYSGPSSVKIYEHCIYCDNQYKDFRDAKEGECPRGCTISPIIKRTE